MYISFPLIFHFRIKSLFNIKFCILSLASRRKLFFNVTYHSVAEFLHCNKIQNLLQSLSPSGSNYCLQGQNLVQTKAEGLLHIKVAFYFSTIILQYFIYLFWLIQLPDLKLLFTQSYMAQQQQILLIQA